MAIGDRDVIALLEDGTPVVLSEDFTLADFIRNSYLQWNRDRSSIGTPICTNIWVHNKLHTVELTITPVGDFDESQRLQ